MAGLDRVRASSPVRRLQAVLARYDAVGGGLMASGLAYAALFALVPGILLLLGIGGLLIGDASDRARLVEIVADVLPPLRDLLTVSLDQLSREARSTSLLGLIGLAWGASRFYQALEGALGRILGQGRRGFFHRIILGIGSVAVLVGAVLAGIVIAGLTSFVEAWVRLHLDSSGTAFVVGLAGVALGVVLAGGAIALVYRFVPPGVISWRALLPPSFAVAVALAILARLFVFLAPRLIGAAAVLGTLATVFAALAWLGLSFQAILLGAAWVAERESLWRAKLDQPAVTFGAAHRRLAGDDGSGSGR